MTATSVGTPRRSPAALIGEQVYRGVTWAFVIRGRFMKNESDIDTTACHAASRP